jgi:hypothetical protein
MFLMAGVIKGFQYERAKASMPWVKDVSKGLVTFIGISELLGGLTRRAWIGRSYGGARGAGRRGADQSGAGQAAHAARCDEGREEPLATGRLPSFGERMSLR